jgi:hypothetical protein
MNIELNWAAFSPQALILGVIGTLIFLIFRHLSQKNGKSIISCMIIYITGIICLGISVYSIGLMLIDVTISKYFSDVDINVYATATMCMMIFLSLGFILLISVIDPTAHKLREKNEQGSN